MAYIKDWAPQPTEAGVMVTRQGLIEKARATGFFFAGDSLNALADALGIPPAAPAPSEKMVKRAYEAGVKWARSEDACLEPRSAFSRGYLAALKHVEKAVREAGQVAYDRPAGGDLIARRAILNQIGAE